MLLNTEHEAKNPEGFKPNVQNTTIYSERSVTNGGRIGYWLLFMFSWLTIIGGIIMTVLRIKSKNRINASQMEINNAASNIDVQLAKRAELLQQLQEEAIAYLRHEGITFKNVSELRSGNVLNANNTIEKQDLVNQMQRSIDLTFENYPNLRGVEIISRLMSESSLLAYEIAAAERTYNNRATQFNAEIVRWPTNVIIDNMHVHTFPLFEASDEQKKAPDLSRISHIQY